MKKTTFILAALLSAACISAQETLTLEQCREMALKYNKEIAAAARQTFLHSMPQLRQQEQVKPERVLLL